MRWSAPTLHDPRRVCGDPRAPFTTSRHCSRCPPTPITINQNFGPSKHLKIPSCVGIHGRPSPQVVTVLVVHRPLLQSTRTSAPQNTSRSRRVWGSTGVLHHKSSLFSLSTDPYYNQPELRPLKTPQDPVGAHGSDNSNRRWGSHTPLPLRVAPMVGSWGWVGLGRERERLAKLVCAGRLQFGGAGHPLRGLFYRLTRLLCHTPPPRVSLPNVGLVL